MAQKIRTAFVVALLALWAWVWGKSKRLELRVTPDGCVTGTSAARA